eukprot:7800425-Pyramimonas_sp.AAC.1
MKACQSLDVVQVLQSGLVLAAALGARRACRRWAARPQDGPETDQDSSKRGPRGPRYGPRSAQE